MEEQSNKHTWLVVSSTAVLICAALCVFLYFYFSSDVYQNSEEFSEFAAEKLNEDNTIPANGYAVTDFEYDEGISTAYRYDEAEGEDIAERCDKISESLIDNCRISAANEDLAELNEDGSYSVPKRAVIVDTCVTDSGTGAVSIAVYCRMYKQDKRSMVLVSSEVKTVLLSADTFRNIQPLQALNVNYKDKASDYCRTYFEKMYSDELSKDWDKYLDPDLDDNFEDFIITESGLKFFFAQGTVLDAREGVASVSVPGYYMDNSIRDQVLNRYIDPSKPMVAITYDDGPGDESEARILKCLEKNNSVATFFYVGNRVSTFAYNGKKAVEIGCEIGNHSWDHSQLSILSVKQIKSQINRTNDTIKENIGVTPTLMRPPYGAFNNKVTDNMNMAAVLWTIDTLDWKTRSPNKIFASVKKTKKLDGKIILMHSIYTETAKATEKIVPWLRNNGYQTVTVSELIKYKTGKAPKKNKVYRKFD